MALIIQGLSFDTTLSFCNAHSVTLEDFQKLSLPDCPGVYFFQKGKATIYVGKATSLRDRVRSYFSRELIDTRGLFIVKMIEEATTITWQETTSVLEALILEAYNIKTISPVYNSKEKDNKSYNYVVITDENYPRVLTVRGREILLGKNKKGNVEYTYTHTFGPFPQGAQLREALRIIRKLFPYRDKCTPFEEMSDPAKARPCFNRQIGMCPGVCTGEVSRKEYLKIIRNIILFFEGKKSQIEKNLLRDMKGHIKDREFEKAQKVKEKIFALNHIRDVTLIKRDVFLEPNSGDDVFRIEAYDIAHMSGKGTVGVMVVLENGEVNRNEYRKFRIRGKGVVAVDDTKNLQEVLTRRLAHVEWPLPDLIVIDGGVAQINVAKKTIKEKKLYIKVVSVVKNDKHKPQDFIGENDIVEKRRVEILLANSEAHRFAIAYHRNLMRKPFQGRG